MPHRNLLDSWRLTNQLEVVNDFYYYVGGVSGRTVSYQAP